MKKNGQSVKKAPKAPAFVARAERAFRRAARNVRAEHHALGLPIIVWKAGKVVARPV